MTFAARVAEALEREDARGPAVLSVTFTLSQLPPSANNLYANKRRGGRFKTVAYKDWIDVAGKEIRLQQRVPMVRGKVRLAYLVGRPPGNRRHDLGNIEKATTDALVRFGVIEDDSLVEGFDRFEWSDTLTGIQVQVRSA